MSVERKIDASEGLALAVSEAAGASPARRRGFVITALAGLAMVGGCKNPFVAEQPGAPDAATQQSLSGLRQLPPPPNLPVPPPPHPTNRPYIPPPPNPPPSSVRYAPNPPPVPTTPPPPPHQITPNAPASPPTPPASRTNAPPSSGERGGGL